MKPLNYLFLQPLSLLVFSSMLSPSLVYADQSPAQQNLRTLFTSSYERDQLDDLRRLGKYKNLQQKTVITKAHKPITVKMQGVVIRDEQPPVIFINNSNSLKSNKIDNSITIKPKSKIREDYAVPIHVKSKHIKLKPGQYWHEQEKSVQDSYNMNSVSKADDNIKEATTQIIE